MLVFAFLFTTVLLSSVDSLERKIGNRGLSVLAVVLLILIVFGTFIGSFISQMSQQAKDFSNRIDKETLTAEFSKLGLEYIPSNGNFVCVNVARPAMTVYESMLKQGVIVRPVANYGLPNHLRVTVGLPQENAKMIAALTVALAS